MRPAALLLLPVLGCAFAQTPVSLELPGISRATFEAGTVVRLPKGPALKSVVVHIPASVIGTSMNAVDIYVDALRPTISVTRRGDDYVVTGATPEGFALTDAHTLRAVLNARPPRTLGEWSIAPWDRAHIEASHAAPGARTPEVRVDEPAGGAFVLSARDSKLAVKGAILSRGTNQLSIAGKSVELDENQAFAIELDVPTAGNEVEIALIETRTGASRRLLLPVARR